MPALVLGPALGPGLPQLPLGGATLPVLRHEEDGHEPERGAVGQAERIGYAGDGLIIVPICFAVFVGAMGFPVLAELFKEWRTPDLCTIHTRLTVWGSIGLLVVGALAFLALEWTNPDTLGSMSLGDKVVTGIEDGYFDRIKQLRSDDAKTKRRVA